MIISRFKGFYTSGIQTAVNDYKSPKKAKYKQIGV